MGCDIHVMCEVKNNGEWKINTENVFPDGHILWCKEYNKEAYNSYIESGRNEFTDSPDDGRFYDWFGLLADVRNGRGFAGVITGEGFTPISEPKGIPLDATDEWKEYAGRWEGDMHSQSYLTLREFLNYDWEKTTKKAGYIPIQEYKTLRETKQSPESWSGGVSGKDIVNISMEEADKLLSGEIIQHELKNFYGEVIETVEISLDDNKGKYVFYIWEVNYKEWFQNKFEQWVTPMQQLKEKYEDVRVVFGFDN